MRRLMLLAISMGIIGLSGCATTQSPVSNVTDLKNADFSQNMKVGQSCANYILGFIGPFGDASIVTAAKNAGLSKVEVVDYKSAWYVLFSQNCVVAYGHS